MRPKHIAFETLLLLVLIPLVVMIFRVIPDRKTASVVAGALFVLVPLIVILWRRRLRPRPLMLWWVAVGQFWLIFAIPILGVRLANWDVEFAQLTWWGLSGTEWHQWSSWSFFAMLLGLLISEGWQWWKGAIA